LKNTDITFNVFLLFKIIKAKKKYTETQIGKKNLCLPTVTSQRWMPEM